ncbi:MAG: hypothetical protein D3925_00360 [Candidatus Electrothrix sp. AR5]|nr:hypothetical protein [Candidatus Electrothrix sp. AR5]
MKKQAIQGYEDNEKADKLRQNKKVSFGRSVVEKIDEDREGFHIWSATQRDAGRQIVFRFSGYFQ